MEAVGRIVPCRKPGIHVIPFVFVVVLVFAFQSAKADEYFSIFLPNRVGYATDFDACRYHCSTKGAYLTWVRNASEQLYIQTNFAVPNVHYRLGAKRDPSNLTLFRWTEGPLGVEHGGKGAPFWYSGSCLMYCNFLATEPNSVTETTVEMVNGKWNDVDAAVGYAMTQHCLCRKEGIASRSQTLSVPTTASRSVSIDTTRSVSITPSGAASSTGSVTPRRSVTTSDSHSSTLTKVASSSLSLKPTLTVSQTPSTILSLSVTQSETRVSPSSTVPFTSTTSPSMSRTSTSSASPSNAPSVTKTTSHCHYVTGDDPRTVVHAMVFDQSTITPVDEESIWNGTTTLPAADNSSTQLGLGSAKLSFTATKANALRSGGGGSPLVIQMVLHPTMHVAPFFTDVVLDTTFSASARVVGSSGSANNGTGIIQLNFKPIGNQFLGQEDTLWIPLHIIAGACVNASAPKLAITLRMTRSLPLVMDITSSIATNTLPVAAIVSPTAAVSMARLSILRSLIECNSALDDDDGNGLLGIAIGPAKGQFMRGAVVGNILLVVAVALVVLFAAATVALYWHLRYGVAATLSFAALCDVLHVPGILMPLVAAVLQPTLASAVQLIALEPVHGDRLLGAMAATVLLGVMVVPFTIVLSRQFCLMLAPRGSEKLRKDRATIERILQIVTCGGLTTNRDLSEEGVTTGGEDPPMVPLNYDDGLAVDDICGNAPDKPPGAATGSTTAKSNHCEVVADVLARVFIPQRQWVPRVAECAAGQRRWKRRFYPVFMDASIWWFPVIDMWLAVLAGVTGGLVLGSKSLCRGQLGAMLSLYLIGAGLQLVVTTALVPASRMYATALQVMGVATCCAIVVVTIQDADGETPALALATLTMLAMAALSSMKGMVDVVGMVVALPRVVASGKRELAALLPPPLPQNEATTPEQTSTAAMTQQLDPSLAASCCSQSEQEATTDHQFGFDLGGDEDCDDLDEIMDQFQWGEPLETASQDYSQVFEAVASTSSAPDLRSLYLTMDAKDVGAGESVVSNEDKIVDNDDAIDALFNDTSAPNLVGLHTIDADACIVPLFPCTHPPT